MATPFLECVVREKFAAEQAAGRVTFPSRKYADDPELFCEEILGYAPTTKQIEILEAVRDLERVAIPAGRKVGKSRILASIGLWWFCQWDDATCVICAPSERQITEISFFDLVGLYHASGRCVACVMRDPDGPRPCEHSTPVDGTLSASVRSGLRSGQRRVIGLAPRNAENARGISGAHQLWLIDESSGVSRAIYEAADGNRASGAKLVVAGNPVSRSTWFYDACEKLGFHTIRISSLDSPNVKLDRVLVPGLAGRAWIEEKRLDWGGEDDPRFQTEVLGIFPSREANRLCSDLELADCFGRHESGTDEGASGPLYFGIDPAGGRGGDKSSIVVRRGNRVLAMAALNTATDGIMAELGILVRKFRRYALEPYWVNFDGSSSFGADLADALRLRKGQDSAMTFFALEMKGDRHTSPVLREARACRLVDAYYLNLQVCLRSEAAIPFDATLREEILFAEFREDHEEGGAKLISKRQYRKQLGRSPDLTDALAFCFWEGRVQPASQAAAEYQRDRADDDLDGMGGDQAPADFTGGSADSLLDEFMNSGRVGR